MERSQMNRGFGEKFRGVGWTVDWGLYISVAHDDCHRSPTDTSTSITAAVNPANDTPLRRVVG